MDVRPKTDFHHFDGVERGAEELRTLIDLYLAESGKLPVFRQIRKFMRKTSEASLWIYLFKLERDGEISIVMTNRGPEVYERHHRDADL